MCVHDLVRDQASASPDGVAVVSGKQNLTYSELDIRSNQLANLLRARGVKPEVPVALCMTRSADFVVGALGILKAGGAYVPIEPSYPQNRVSAILRDCGAPLLLTHDSLDGHLPVGPWQTILMADAILCEQPDSAPESGAGRDNLAYIVFTSGSTGRPKGVEITHSNLLNLIAWHRRAFRVGPADRATVHACPGFDAAVWELWPYLVSGASLHVVDESVRASAEPLRDWLVANRITITFLPTALAEFLIYLSWPAETALRILLTGADTLRHYPPADLPFALVNNYGPTECTVVASSGKVPTCAIKQESPSIGMPIDNVQIYIVDQELRPVGSGIPGELVIGGAGVGRGYVNLPATTAKTFIPDHFRGEAGARLYRTGDLARFLPNGEIAFLGRIDEQIKIRGFRIEPREIVVGLAHHPSIHSSFVSGIRDSCGENQLVAYVVLAPNATTSPEELRTFLAKDLPDYMVPSAFVRMEELPLTERGKIDRAALPCPTGANLWSDGEVEAPPSPVEGRISEIVGNLLGVARIGRQENFFNLGGHSLMGAQIIAKIRDVFAVEVSLRSLFDEPTIAGISLQVENLVHAKVAAMSDEEVEHLLASSGM